MRRVLFLVCHLSGTGHLARTLMLARGVAAAGAHAVVVSGGPPAPHLDASGVDLIQLPPLRVADLDFSRLLTLDGSTADEAYRASRAVALHAALEATRPDVLVCELFPFGRRALADEFELAVTMAQARGAAIWCSLRDIPEPPRKARRFAEAHARLAPFAGVLVHGDAGLTPLSLGWPAPSPPPVPVHHTGYVAEPPPPPRGDPDEVLVAEGGGALGEALLRCAIAAAALADGRPWRLRVGGGDPARPARLRGAAGAAPAIVEPVAPDYRARLAACAASVSLLGYNTAVDLLRSGAPAVVCPLARNGEREQVLRADAFAALPQFETLAEAALTPDALAATVARAIARGRQPASPARLDGVARSVALLLA